MRLVLRSLPRLLLQSRSPAAARNSFTSESDDRSCLVRLKLTREDVARFAAATGDTNPIHLVRHHWRLQLEIIVSC